MADLPWPIDAGSTHWEGCYRERRHHNCAVVEVDRLRAENERLLEEAFDMGVDMTAMRDEIKRLRASNKLMNDCLGGLCTCGESPYSHECLPCDAIIAAREALEADDDS